jgi:phthalate 4,5-cis-dihydrodiol dehydrogenase
VADELGILIIGAGRVSNAHAQAVADTPGTKIIGAVDIDRGRVDAFAAKHNCLGFTDRDEALKRDDVDLVMIGLPNDLHAPVTIEAASAGKHIFLEKPMANTFEECDRMIAAVKKANIKLLVAHSQRYFASSIKTKELIQGGNFGNPVFATDTWYKPFGIAQRLPWFLDRAQGGGMWLMNGAHMIDRTCYVLDTDVVAVKATIATRFHDIKTDDADMALLQLRNGNYATIVHAGYKDRGVGKCEVEITLTNGMIKFDSYSNMLQVDDNGQYKPIALERVNPFTAELHNLVGAIRGTEELKVTPEWGRHIMEVMYACEESSRTGKEVRVG